jgi:hypothetical protein
MYCLAVHVIERLTYEEKQNEHDYEKSSGLSGCG